MVCSNLGDPMTVVVEPLTPSEILDQAADLLEAGWCQFHWILKETSPIDRKMCSLGAMRMVALGKAEGYAPLATEHNKMALEQAHRILARHVRPMYNEAHGGIGYDETIVDSMPSSIIIGWNDMPWQNADEVVHQFRIAQKIAAEDL